MQATFIVLLCAICAVLAYPQHHDLEPEEQQLYEEDLPYGLDDSTESLQRVRRQLNVQGGGSPRQGFDLSVNGRAPVWQSNNGRHQFDVTGQYSQHLGGPYGNSRPNFGGGGMYTFRF